MGRAPCCDKEGLKKGPWTPEEDKILVDYIQFNGHGSWRSLPKLAGLLRCGKSCRLRWTNYLRPDIKRGPFTPEEQKSIIQLHAMVGNKWSTIAAQLPGRTDNEIKNYWNTYLKKRLRSLGIRPHTSASSPSSAAAGSDGAGAGGPAASSAVAPAPSPATRHMAQWESARLEAEARLSRESLLFSASSAAATADSSVQPDASSSAKTDTDFFLRIWNSTVGEAFRGKEAAAANSPASPSARNSSSVGTAAVKAEGEGERNDGEGSNSASSDDQRDDVECCKISMSVGGDVAAAAAVRDSSSSNETEDQDTSDEDTYRMYLNFGGDDMALGSLFQSHLGSFSLFGGCDLNDAASFDTPFK